ncbi:MAG: DUF262 domain-containing protein, partial [Victivallales bacterium]|nr:DUF262 domain-containing protein [Victivallales bacterium]
NEAHGNSFVWKQFAKALGKHEGEIKNKLNGYDGPLHRIHLELTDLKNLKVTTEKLIDAMKETLGEVYGDMLPQEDGSSQLLPNPETVAIVQNTPCGELLKESLCIPDYQREYCWSTQNVLGLFQDIKNAQRHLHYHLGTIILKKTVEGYDVIDGQQRLTTLAIWKHLNSQAANSQQKEQEIPLLKSRCKMSAKARNALSEAKQSLEEFKLKLSSDTDIIDLDRVVLSVVVLGKNQSDDLAYTFFSNSNSTGKRLSDYDLLKTHHLRYIQHEETAKNAVRNWHVLEKADGMEPLIHHTLFRLRNWNCGSPFRFNASSDPDRRDIYKHFCCTIDESTEYSTLQLPQFQFDSILPGGQAFFEYVEHYRRLFSVFEELDIIKKLNIALGGHSNGVIRDAIKAISFLFYCKFGASYLVEAVYALSYWLSQLRNAPRVMRQYIDSPLFRETTSFLDRVSTVSQFLSSLLDSTRQYPITNRMGTASYYWRALHLFLAEIEKNSDGLKKIGMSGHFQL